MNSSKEDTSFIKDLPKGPLDEYRKQASFDWKKLKLVLEDRDLLKIKLKLWDKLEKDPIFHRSDTPLDTEEMKRRTAIQTHRYCQYNFLPPDTINLPYKKKTRYMMTLNEALAHVFPDVSIKHGVGVGLLTNTLTTLGTERHKPVLEAAWKGKVIASLALTEVAHGSNTKQMRTTATFNKDTQEFIINTPDFEAAKCWVGNLGKTCTMAVLFAQLYTQGQCHGLHAFLVPIRDPQTLKPYPGIIVGDIGEKIALHGIDNGFIMFHNYRIPRENLLNRTADVTPDGDYESSFTDPARILGAALENLSTGRVAIVQESNSKLINAVVIAVRYAAVRKQFSDSDNIEKPIIEYQLHQWRLFPYVAAAVVFQFFISSFTDEYLTTVEQSTTNAELEDLSARVSEIHALVSCAKPLLSWTCRDAAQESREACGGHGFLYAARFGELKANIDPLVTYEGDNNVLLQQTSNWLIRQWDSLLNNDGKFASPLGSCTFLTEHKTILNRKFNRRSVQQLFDLKFIIESYEWLVTYLVQETFSWQQKLQQIGETRFCARNNSQVYRAAVLAKAYAEYNVIKHFVTKIQNNAIDNNNKLNIVLERLGLLYSLTRLEKHLVYFYEGGYASGSDLSQMVKQGILDLCTILKPDILGVVDALAPPDYVLNSVLGKSDGKLYENLQTLFFHNKNALSRPDWWRDVLIEDVPDLKLVSKM